jgi:hypothetical protein
MKQWATESGADNGMLNAETAFCPLRTYAGMVGIGVGRTRPKGKCNRFSCIVISVAK